MKITKMELNEIIDSNGDLIGKSAIPKTGSDLETQASNTTDYNAKINMQPFRYDMLGRFGFTLLPFFEGKENQAQTEFLSDLAQLMHEKYADTLKYYYKNPNKLKSDYRKQSENEHSDECKKNDAEWAKKVIKTVEKHFENAFKEPDKIDEAKIVEDKLVGKKGEDEISKKSKDNDVQTKHLEKIAGLINKKLEKKDIDKLINLLERG
jgi:hypothetical protein